MYVYFILNTHLSSNFNLFLQNGLNALHLAAKDGHIAVVEELIKRGATVDAATKKGIFNESFESIVN